MDRNFYKNGKFRLTAKVVSVLLFSFLINGSVYGKMSSTSYQITRDVIGGGGGARSSSSYRITDTLAESFVKTSKSPDYVIGSGFWSIFTIMHDLSGIVTLEYPGWLLDTAEVMYQVREPGLPPTEPLYEDTLTVFVTTGYPASGTFTINGILAGTYDIALKHANHLADIIQDVAVSSTDVTGLEFVLWAGDADGDDNASTAEATTPSDSKGDNDVDLLDYFTFYYQYHGGLPITSGCNADFDADGNINLPDYFGFYYGYHNCPDPGIWY